MQVTVEFHASYCHLARGILQVYLLYFIEFTIMKTFLTYDDIATGCHVAQWPDFELIKQIRSGMAPGLMGK